MWIKVWATSRVHSRIQIYMGVFQKIDGWNNKLLFWNDICENNIAYVISNLFWTPFIQSVFYWKKKSFTKHSRMQYLVISQTEPTEITYSIEILRTIHQYCHMVGMKGEGRVSGAWENTERGQGNVRWRMIDYEKYFVESSNTHQGNGKRTFLDLVRHLLETPRKT